MGSGVVQVVGTSRALGAVLVAVGVVLAGCTSGDGDDGPTTATTTSPAVAEASGSPWDLPLEQRPALFDPCEEIPIEAVEDGVGDGVEPVTTYVRHRPGELMSCGWKSKEVHVTVLSTWKSRSEYLVDQSFAVADEASTVGGREALRLTEGSGTRSCLQLYFTEVGTVWVGVDLVDGLSEFRGRPFAEACDVLDEALIPVLDHLPQGDFT